MPRIPIKEFLPPWSSRIRPYPPGKPIEEVERELGHTAIKLASNENPLGPSPKALEAIRRCLDRVHLYPDGGGYYLRKKLAEGHGLEMDQVILGAGSTDLIELVAKTFLTAGDEAITSESAFYIYRLAIEEMGTGLVLPPMRNATFDLAAIAHAVTHRTKVVYLGNPNNPTGTMFTADELDRFLESVSPRVLAALDDREHVARSIESNRQEMKFLTEELTVMGVRYTPSVANFLLIDTGRDCEDDFVRLLHEGVIVRPMKIYKFPTSLRVTAGTHKDNLLFLEALHRVMTAPVRAGKV